MLLMKTLIILMIALIIGQKCRLKLKIPFLTEINKHQNSAQLETN